MKRGGKASTAGAPPRGGPAWLLGGGANDEPLMGMDRRLRPVRRRALLVMAAVLVLSAPWVGWWTLVPLVAAGALFRLADTRTDSARHPEHWMLGARIGAEAIIASRLALTGESSVYFLALLAIPVETLSARFSYRGVWLGVGMAAALMVTVALGTGASQVGHNPPLLIVPIGVAIAIAMLSAALMQSDLEHRDKAIVDPLTGLLNRHALDRRAGELEQQSLVAREPVAVIVVDVDGFKELNDTHGHDIGDEVLAEVAQLLHKGSDRAFDYAYRIGGDEFVILVPGATIEDTRTIVGRARESVCSAIVGGGLRVSVSGGVSASESGEPFDYTRVFKAADGALLEAKRSRAGVAFAPSAMTTVYGSTQAERAVR